MKIILENSYLVPAINFLQGLKLKGKDSRSRSKLVKLINQGLTSLQESEQQLLNDYADKDEKGNVIFVEDSKAKISPINQIEFNKEHKALLKEKAEIEGGTYVNHIDDCHKILDDYKGELSGVDAEVYDVLLDAFENDQTKKEGKQL